MLSVEPGRFEIVSDRRRFFVAIWPLGALFVGMRENARCTGLELTSRLLTIEDVARMLNVGPRFVRRLVSERRIVFHKVGRYVRFDATDVAAWISASRVDSTSGDRRAR